MVTGPRANFSCKNCGKMAGTLPVKIEDLPVACVRCPVCGHKRGFTRLFDALGGVMSSKTNNVAKMAEDVLKPMYDQHSARKTGSENFARAGKEAMEKTYEKATPQERAKIQPFGMTAMPAQAAMGGIPPEARAASRELTFPASKRFVTPQWADTKK